jgi:hypothetical protein
LVYGSDIPTNNANKPAIKGSDVEMKDASSIKQIVSTKQKQLDFLK